MGAEQKIARLEASILGILMNWPELVTTVPFDIRIFNRYRKVVSEMIRQINDGIRPDIITITDAFPDDKHLLFDLGVLMRDCPSSANYANHVEKLTETVTDVEIFKDFQSATRQIAEGTPVKDAITGVVNAVLLKVNNLGRGKHDYDGEAIAKVLLDELEYLHDNKASDISKLKTGIAGLDDIVGHFQPSDLVVVGARPGVGKTAWAISSMLNMALSGKRIGFISTEMSVQQVAFRMASQLSGIVARKYRDGTIAPHEWQSVSDAAAAIRKMNIHINDKPEMKMSEIIMQCRAWDMHYKLDTVFVDYLTRIKPDKEGQSRVNDVGELAASFKNIARTLKIPVIVLAQLNRGVENRAEKVPKMSDLRDSGIIEQEADIVLLLHREIDKQLPPKDESFFGLGNPATAKNDLNLIIVEKNRHGEVGEIEINYDKPLMRWY